MKLLTLSLTLILTGTGLVRAETRMPVAELEWRSVSRSDAEIAIELADLYTALYNSGNLTVRAAQLTSSPFVEVLLRDEGVFRGAFFPEKLDALLCDLNPELCARDRQPVAPPVLQDVRAHVGGFAPSRGQWAAPEKATVSIPDYRLDQVTVLERIEVPSTWTPEDYVPADGVDCAAWNESCDALVRRFNPPTIRRAKGTVRVTVPQLALSTVIALKEDDRSNFSNVLAGLGKAQHGDTVARLFVEADSWSAEWGELSTRNSPNDLALDALRDNLRPVGTVSNYTVDGEPHFAAQVDLFKLIDHPFGALEALPEEYRRPVGVLVIDSKLSTGHCDWTDAQLMNGDILEAPEEPAVPDTQEASAAGTPAVMPAAECATIDELALSDGDHATAVGGLIASQVNGKGMVGLNPAARLRFLEFDRNAVPETQIQTLVNQVQGTMPEDTRVANMSFGILQIFGNFTEVEVALAAQGSRMLFVAAAGNEGRALDAESCPILPACLNALDNVITVVGLNADSENPAIWRTATAASNTSPNFEIGAIADNVLSTVSNNRFAHKSGTSIAAPQVAAAASLIFAAGELIYADNPDGAQLAPKIVKDRLIYTADYFAELTHEVKAGRLNVKRSLHVKHAQFELFDGRRIVGQVLQAPDEFACRTPVEAQKFQKWWNVRRLVYNDVRERHIVFRHVGDGLGDRYATLDRYPSCIVTTASAPVEVRVRNGDGFETVAFRFEDIRDYTSPLFDE